MTTLHLICGLPGSGKSTLAKQLEADECLVRFTPDEWMIDLGFELYDPDARQRIEQLQWRIAKQLLSTGQSVSLENGFWVKAERLIYKAAAEEMKVAFKLHYLDVPLHELQRRVARRNALVAASEKVNIDDLTRWFEAFEIPTADELASLTPESKRAPEAP